MKIITIPSEDNSCNVYVILSSLIALIDTGRDARLIQKLRKIGIRPEQVSIVINTHCHYDHISCNDFFTEAAVCMHEIDAKHVENMDEEFTLSRYEKDILPKVDKKLVDGDTINLGGGKDVEDEGEKLLIIHTPGHTAGSICILAPGGQLFTGDTLFAGSIGRTDLPSGSEGGMRYSLQKLSKIPFRVIYPGHGPSATKEEVVKFLRTLRFPPADSGGPI